MNSDALNVMTSVYELLFTFERQTFLHPNPFLHLNLQSVVTSYDQLLFIDEIFTQLF